MYGLSAKMAIILAFSDSICKYVSNHATFSSDILFSLNAHPGASVYDLTSDISRHPFVEPDLVFVHAGTNCLPMHRPLSRTLDDFSYLISVTKSRFPSASVVISSILPRFDSEVYDRRRSELNSHLLHLCSRQGVFFLDNGSRARRAMFSVDGLHLSRAGNISYAKYLSFSLSHYLQLHRRSCQHRFTLRGEEWPGLGTDGGSGKKDKEHPGEEPKSGEYQGQVEWARVVRQGGPVARAAPGKVEGGSVGKGPSQPRGVPVVRSAPGKVVGGSVGKGPSQPRGVPVVRSAPGKVVGGSVGKGPSQPRGVPVVRSAPGKVEGGSVGKGPSHPRGVPVVRSAPGKVVGGSVGKGPSQPRGVPVVRSAPGKVVGGSVGKGPSQPRGVPVVRSAPGKVVGGSVGKGPSQPRGVPVVRSAPGKVVGGSVGKGPSQPRGVPVVRSARGKVEGGSVGKGPSQRRGVAVARAAPGKVKGGNAGKGPLLA
ncbi:collagen alpha-1(I) chain-like [Branchiostoma floridae]|uniref:1-alkyl-2-acetylglycerophosphocholine esterase n=1 Tax=Branchiostoma floridae TaxID=7739 RepID=A0A9J7MWB0_BRAFL|nr:collagen alpha-1(I) chain-like [Branchiostoma floridae]